MLMTMLITTEATIDCRLRPGGQVARWRGGPHPGAGEVCGGGGQERVYRRGRSRHRRHLRGDKGGHCETRRVGGGTCVVWWSAGSHTGEMCMYKLWTLLSFKLIPPHLKFISYPIFPVQVGRSSSRIEHSNYISSHNHGLVYPRLQHQQMILIR